MDSDISEEEYNWEQRMKGHHMVNLNNYVPKADLRKLREWVNERYTATNHNYFLEMSDKMNELELWEVNDEKT